MSCALARRAGGSDQFISVGGAIKLDGTFFFAAILRLQGTVELPCYLTVQIQTEHDVREWILFTQQAASCCVNLERPASVQLTRECRSLALSETIHSLRRCITSLVLRRESKGNLGPREKYRDRTYRKPRWCRASCVLKQTQAGNSVSLRNRMPSRHHSCEGETEAPRRLCLAIQIVGRW